MLSCTENEHDNQVLRYEPDFSSRITPGGREMFTTRADDSHAAPVFWFPCGHGHVSAAFQTCQALVRFLAYRRIEPHAPPLVRVPVNSFEF